MRTWQLQEAKSHFSQLIKDAMLEGPQEITLRGEPVAVILSMEAFENLQHPKPSFIEFMRHSPLVGVELDLKRDSSSTRDTEL